MNFKISLRELPAVLRYMRSKHRRMPFSGSGSQDASVEKGADASHLQLDNGRLLDVADEHWLPPVALGSISTMHISYSSSGMETRIKARQTKASTCCMKPARSLRGTDRQIMKPADWSYLHNRGACAGIINCNRRNMAQDEDWNPIEGFCRRLYMCLQHLLELPLQITPFAGDMILMGTVCYSGSVDPRHRVKCETSGLRLVGPRETRAGALHAQPAQGAPTRNSRIKAMPVRHALCATGLALASLTMTTSAKGITPNDADRHRLAAERQAFGDKALEARRRAWCNPATGPADTGGATQALTSVEQAYQAARLSPNPPSDAILRDLVVQRQCAAFRVERMQPDLRLPVWLISRLAIVKLSPAAGARHGLQVEAIASNIDGPVVHSHLVFAQGLHMACFGVTDERGALRCTLVDIHPHGDSAGHDTADEAHTGPVIATLAGSVSPDRVELPAVAKRRAGAVAAVRARDSGIAAQRLVGNGVASLAPVASNASEEGRARSRRVELVPQ